MRGLNHIQNLYGGHNSNMILHITINNIWDYDIMCVANCHLNTSVV